MDAVSFSKAAQQATRIGKIINEPDAISGLVTLPSTIAVGETITIPAGRTVVHPNLQVDGTLNVQGTMFIPSGGIYSPALINADVVQQGGLNMAVDSTVVHKTGDETIAGVKTFNGTVTLPSTTSIGTVTGTEIGYVDGVTSAIQTQLDTKQRMVLMTAQDCTSGTVKDFVGIPSWAKRITVMFNGVSTSGTSLYLVQIGSGVVTVSGYTSSVIAAKASAATIGVASIAGFIVLGSIKGEGQTHFGSVVINQIATNVYTSTGVITDNGSYGATVSNTSSGISPMLAGPADRIRITTVNGTDTFDAGQIGVLYEG